MACIAFTLAAPFTATFTVLCVVPADHLQYCIYVLDHQAFSADYMNKTVFSGEDHFAPPA